MSQLAIEYSYTSLRPVASYVDRPTLQKQIEEQLGNAPSARATCSRILPLIGLGGAGKSQLARNYIQTHRKDYFGIFWVDARLQESVERDYRQIHSLLFGHKQDSASLQLDIDQIVTAVRACLNTRDGRCLFVFDNADSIENETDPYFVDLHLVFKLL